MRKGYFLLALAVAAVIPSGCSSMDASSSLNYTVNTGSGNGPDITASDNYVTKAVKVSAFNAITTSTAIDVEYRVGNSRRVSVYAPDNIIDYVDVNVSGNSLNISFKSNKNINFKKHNKVKVSITAPDVLTFRTESAGDIDILSPISTTRDVTLICESAGDIEATSISCSLLTATTSSAGDIDVEKAVCKTLRAEANSAGDIDIEGISADRVEAVAASAGDISLSGRCKVASLMQNSAGSIKASRLKADKMTLDKQ